MRAILAMGLIGALAAAGVAYAPTAEAGGSRHSGHFGGHHGGSHFGGHHGGRHFGGGHRVRGGHHFRGRHHGGHGTAKFFYGLGAGLLLYHALDRSYDRDRYYYSEPRRVYRVAEPPRYVPAPQPVASTGQSAPSCLQTREYQTIITIGGEQKEAYGTACLKPDGSWQMGPPELVPEFE